MRNALKLIIALSITTVILLSLNSYTSAKDNHKSETKEERAKILTVDNSNVISSGISSIGFQQLTVEILTGKLKGQVIDATAQLVGKMDFDNFYKEGDTIIIGLLMDNDEVLNAKALELYRGHTLLLLFALFTICLIVFAKVIGLKALVSFIASVVVIWFILIQGLLKGYSPLLLSFFTVLLLSFIIIFSVAGLSKKGLSAFLGTLAGLTLTLATSMLFGSRLGLNGMTQPFSETILFSGYHHLNMLDIFYSAIIIGASGAAMDIAMDVAASVEEVYKANPEINRDNLIKAGYRVGQHVIGTMTTTLLLAYTGSYLTLLMLFMSKDLSFSYMFNVKIVSAEVFRTIIGSLGLVLVAPITALASGWIYTNRPS